MKHILLSSRTAPFKSRTGQAFSAGSSVFLLLFSMVTHADQVAVSPSAAAAAEKAAGSPTSNSSFTVTLARQAGTIAGAAQACGQDISLLSARLDETITSIAKDNIDAVDAVLAYQQSEKEAAKKQTSEQVMPCNIVLKDYQSVPLLRDDYKEVVISALKAQTMPNPVSAAPVVSQTQPTPPPAP
jgi:hypothetical protein